MRATLSNFRSDVTPEPDSPAQWNAQHEWMIRDGAGGYASLCALFYPTRRQHGLLVCPTDEWSERHVFLSRYDETIECDDAIYALNGWDYPPDQRIVTHPLLTSLTIYPTPRFEMRCGDLTVLRSVEFLQPGSLRITYRLEAENPRVGHLRLRPLLAFREANGLTVENLALNSRCQRDGATVVIKPYATLPSLTFATHPAAVFHADPVWYRNVRLARDGERGYDDLEDHFSPGEFECEFVAPCTIEIVATLVLCNTAVLAARQDFTSCDLASACVATNVPLFPPQTRAKTPSLDDLGAWLNEASELFLYRRRDASLGILAGLPWFAEWGRDTFISLPGLTLARGDEARAHAIVYGSLPYLRQGLMPNIFGDTSQNSRYNSIDAALWYVRALDLLDQAKGRPLAFARDFSAPVLAIVEAYSQGFAALGVHCDAQEHLILNDPQQNLTWMDAQIDGIPVTPRLGAPVEINALWYAALDYASELARRVDAPQATLLQERCCDFAKAFLARFWQPTHETLADLWLPPTLRVASQARDERPLAVRPNMILAAALARSPLTPTMRKGVVAQARAKLLTPRGLRSLAADDPAYCRTYEGGPLARDRAYHQGTVWPWLTGAWVEASLRAGATATNVTELSEYLQGFAAHLYEAGLGQISELADAEAPHLPRGAVAQAWSVAEVLRAIDLVQGWSCES